MNFLLAIDERAAANQPPEKIQDDFHIKVNSYEKYRWILEFVRDAIERSTLKDEKGHTTAALSLVNFEAHKGKLEELYNAYAGLKAANSDQAEALREQRLLALVLDKSKTDLRLIEPDFMNKFMKSSLPESDGSKPAGVKIPGINVTVVGPSSEVVALRQLTTRVLQAKSTAINSGGAKPEEVTEANSFLGGLDESLGKALDQAGKQGRVLKRKFAASDRLSDACDDLDLTISAVAEAKGTGNFDPADLDDTLLTFKSLVSKLSAIINRGTEGTGEGTTWLRAVASIDSENS